MSKQATVRHATRDDIPTILNFIRELAIYEKALDKVEATEQTLDDTIFKSQYARVLIADVEQDGAVKPAGFALYFFAYSTWKAQPTLHLEDLFVLPERRSLGIGKRIFQELGRIAKENKCGRVEWQVLTWNECVDSSRQGAYIRPALGFYKNTLHAELLEEWRIMRLDGNGIDRLAHLQ